MAEFRVHFSSGVPSTTAQSAGTFAWKQYVTDHQICRLVATVAEVEARFTEAECKTYGVMIHSRVAADSSALIEHDALLAAVRANRTKGKP